MLKISGNPFRAIASSRASKVIVVAQRLKDSLGYGEVIPCGIDVKKFARPSCLGNRPSPKMPGELKVLFPSDPARKVKNYSLFQAVCKELEKRVNKADYEKNY